MGYCLKAVNNPPPPVYLEDVDILLSAALPKQDQANFPIMHIFLPFILFPPYFSYFLCQCSHIHLVCALLRYMLRICSVPRIAAKEDSS